MKIIFFALISVAVIFEAIADFYFKKWSIENKTSLFSIGVVLYTVGTFIWAYSLKYEFLSKAISIFTVLNLIIIVLVGVFFFKEDLSLLNKLGIMLGVASIFLMQI